MRKQVTATATIACPACKGSGKVQVFDGAAFKEERERRKIRACWVADRVGISGGFLSDLESGNKQPSPEVAARLLSILNPVEAA